MIYLTSSVITCRCRKWVINTRRIEELLPKTSEQLCKNYKLCAKHFEDSQLPRSSRAAYRQVVFDQMLMQSVGSNCTTDMDSVLLSLMTLINISHKEPAIPTDQFQPVLSDEQDIAVQPADIMNSYLGWS